MPKPAAAGASLKPIPGGEGSTTSAAPFWSSLNRRRNSQNSPRSRIGGVEGAETMGCFWLWVEAAEEVEVGKVRYQKKWWRKGPKGAIETAARN
jgi:hypothetical protein